MKNNFDPYSISDEEIKKWDIKHPEKAKQAMAQYDFEYWRKTGELRKINENK